MLIHASSASVAIGYDNFGNNEYFNGKMDEVRIWNVARTQAEIQANMNKELSEVKLAWLHITK